MIPTRPAVLRSDRPRLQLLSWILEDALRDPASVSVRVIEPWSDDVDGGLSDSHPWSTEWIGIALRTQGRAAILPVVGEWPFGPDRHGDDLDPADLSVEDVIEALRSIVVVEGEDADPTRRFEEHLASSQRILDVMVAHAQGEPDHAAACLACDDGQGGILCELGMDEHGLPVLFMENASEHMHVDVGHARRLAIARLEPICLTARWTDDALDGTEDSIVLTPVRSMSSLETMEARRPDAIGAVRTLAAHRDALAQAGIPHGDDDQGGNG